MDSAGIVLKSVALVVRVVAVDRIITFHSLAVLLCLDRGTMAALVALRVRVAAVAVAGLERLGPTGLALQLPVTAGLALHRQ